jgi:hypothetical protein
MKESAGERHLKKKLTEYGVPFDLYEMGSTPATR